MKTEQKFANAPFMLQIVDEETFILSIKASVFYELSLETIEARIDELIAVLSILQKKLKGIS